MSDFYCHFCDTHGCPVFHIWKVEKYKERGREVTQHSRVQDSFIHTSGYSYKVISDTK